MALSGSIYDPAANSFDPNLDTEVTHQFSDALPADPYRPTFNYRTFRNDNGVTGSFFETGNVTLYNDSTGNSGIIYDYGGGYKTYQFDRPPLSQPERCPY